MSPVAHAAGPVLAWTVTNVDPSAISLDGISCPNNGLCVAVDDFGNVVTSSNPTGGAAAWTVTNVDGSGTNFHVLSGVSCPSSSLCVAVDDAGNVVTSGNPTGGAATWTVTHVDSSRFGLEAVSCPSSSLCVAVDSTGNVVTSNNPTGGAPAWTVTNVVDANGLFRVSCPSSSLCVAVDFAGNVVTSSNPTGGATTWTLANVDSANWLRGVSCPNNGLCVAVDVLGNMVTSSNPTGGAAAWTVTNVDGSNSMNAVSCSSGGLCVAVDGVGDVLASSNPTGGAGAWTMTNVDGLNFINDVSCPSSSLCVAADQVGNVVTGILVATATTTTVASSSNPSTVGSGVTYTATVAPTPDGGTVAFTDNGTTLTGCGAVAVNTATGKATCTTSYGAVGSHAIVASYSGHLNYTGSSGSLIQQVNPTVPAVAVLPAMSNGAYGGYITAATIQNTGSAAATVEIGYYNQNGSLVGAGDSISNLPVNASWTVRQDNGNSFPSSGGNAAQAGSAVVYSSQPIASFVNEFAPSTVGDATSYSGVQVPSGVGATLYAPTVVNNAYGGYTTGIGLLNTGSSPTDVTITYRDGTGAVTKTQTIPGLAARAYQALYSGDASLALPNGFAGTATITSSAAQPLGAIVNETGPGGQFSSYDAVPAGTTILYAPVALRNAFGGYNTGIGIVDTTGASGTVTINYYNSSGTATTSSAPIAANGSLGVYQGTDIPADGAYTAKITSTVPIAAIVNEVAASSTSAKQSTAYNTFAAGSATLHFPLVESAGSDGWSTGDGIMNTGATTTTVTVKYFNTNTGAAVGTTQTTSLAPNAFWGLYQPSGGLPNGARATAVITTSAGGQVAAICNESNSTTFMSYVGQ